MNFDDNINEVFDRYLTGQMTEVEEREFLAELEKDPALKQNYEAHRAIVAGIREARKEELKDYIKQNAKIRYLGNIWGQKWIISSAAIVTVLITAYFVIEFIAKPQQSKNTAENTEQTENDLEATEDINNENDSLGNTFPEAYDGYNELSQEQLNNAKAEVKKRVPTVEDNLKNKSNKASANKNLDATIDVYYEVADSTQYKYDGSKLTLYRFPYQDDVVIYQTEEDRDYMAWRRSYYELLKDDKAHSLKEITDAKTIEKLRNLK